MTAGINGQRQPGALEERFGLVEALVSKEKTKAVSFFWRRGFLSVVPTRFLHRLRFLCCWMFLWMFVCWLQAFPQHLEVTQTVVNRIGTNPGASKWNEGPNELVDGEASKGNGTGFGISVLGTKKGQKFASRCVVSSPPKNKELGCESESRFEKKDPFEQRKRELAVSGLVVVQTKKVPKAEEGP